MYFQTVPPLKVFTMPINTGPWVADPQGSVFIVSHNADNAGGAGLHYA